jgi:ketosteroid isomerase-like protein
MSGVHTTGAVRVVDAYLDAVQRARRGDDAAWADVRSLVAEDAEIRAAGYGGADLWRGPIDRDAWLARLRDRPWDVLRTETTRVFGDDRAAVAEQVSTVVDEGRETRLPVCFVFDVANQRIRRISVYRNDFAPPADG